MTRESNDAPASQEIDANRKIVDEYRNSKGRLGNWYNGGPLLLLHTTGAKSGEPRVNPVLYRDLGDGRYAIFAAHRGSPKHPAWYFNLLAQPLVDIEFGTRTEQVTARVARGAERTAIWTDHIHDYPNFIAYEAQANREIPVIVLEPRTLPRASSTTSHQNQEPDEEDLVHQFTASHAEIVGSTSGQPPVQLRADGRRGLSVGVDFHAEALGDGVRWAASTVSSSL